MAGDQCALKPLAEPLWIGCSSPVLELGGGFETSVRSQLKKRPLGTVCENTDISLTKRRGPFTHVRGELLDSSFVLTRVEAGRTMVVAEMHADPKGDMPKWLVNMFQKGWAHTTITRLRAQVAKPGYVENAMMRDKLKEHGFYQ